MCLVAHIICREVSGCSLVSIVSASPSFLFILPSLIVVRAPNLCAKLQTTHYGSVSGWVRTCGGSSSSHTVLSDDSVRVSPPAAHHQLRHETQETLVFMFKSMHIVRYLNHQWLTHWIIKVLACDSVEFSKSFIFASFL